MIGARSGHATARQRRRADRRRGSPRSYAPLATVAGVASRPMRPLRVVRDRLDRLRPDDADDVDAERRLHRARCSAGSAAAVAELHATTSSLAPRASSTSAISSAKRSQLAGRAVAVREARRVRRGRGSPRAAAARAARAAPSGRRRRSRRRRSGAGALPRGGARCGHARQSGPRAPGRGVRAGAHFPTPSIASLSFVDDRLRDPLVRCTSPLAITTPARSPPASRISPTYSTVPWPRCSRPRAHARAIGVRSQPIACDSPSSSPIRRPSARWLSPDRSLRRWRVTEPTCPCTNSVPISARLAVRMRALVVTNMYPSPAGRRSADSSATRSRRCGDRRPRRRAPRSSPPGGARSYARAARDLRRRFRAERFDVVHAHFGLDGLAGARGRRATRVVTLHGNDLLPPALARDHARRPAAAWTSSARRRRGLRRRTSRAPAPRAAASRSCRAASTSTASARSTARAARARLGLDPDGRYLLFPDDPARPVKRADRARELAPRATRGC